MRAKDVMTRRVAAIGPGATVREAARLMIERDVSGLPVVEEDGRVIGMVTEGDLVRRRELDTEPEGAWWLVALADGAARDYRKAHAMSVRDVMSRPVFGVRPGATLRQVAKLMHERGIKRVPVLEDRRLVGIVSRADLVRRLARARGLSRSRS
jgi:CBS domain-containing protein